MGGRGTAFRPPSRRGGGRGPSFPKNGVAAPIQTLREVLSGKGKPKSITEAARRANPSYDIFNDAYSMNCQRCVVAYELLRRGYNVEAMPTYANDKWPQVPYMRDHVMWGRWMGAFRNAQPIHVGARGNWNKTMDNIAKQMRGWGNGSRAVIEVFYSGGGGHVFNVENVNGRIQFIEAQAGQAAKDMTRLSQTANVQSINLVRTDNLRISDRAKEFVTKTRKR